MRIVIALVLWSAMMMASPSPAFAEKYSSWNGRVLRVLFEPGEPKKECVKGCEKKYTKCRDNPAKCADKRRSCVRDCPKYSAKDCRKQCESEYISCSGDMKKCAAKRKRCVESRC